MVRYDSYKDSGIQWLGQIPGHWEVKRFGTLFKLKPFKEHRDNDEMLSVFLDRGIIRACESEKRTHNPSEDLSKYQLVEPSDFVMNNQQAWRGSVGVSALRGIISPAYHIFTLPNDLYHEYANIMLRDKNMVSQYEIASRGVGSIQRTLNFNWLNASKVLIPPIEEQKSIVSYLDRETEKIDSFIADKEKELALLDELKQAEIANAVTKGLHPDVKMKDSGIAWLGNIPEHWGVIRLKWLITEIKEKSETGEELPLSLTSKNGLIPFSEKENRTMVSSSYVGAKIIRPGQVVFNRFKARLFAISHYTGLVSPDYAVYELNERVVSEFAVRLFGTALFRQQMNLLAEGIGDGFSRLYTEDLCRLEMPIPPIDEQKAIVDYIERKCDTINNLMSNIEQEIAQLKEYKQRLIADAVTGQIKVC